MNIIYIQRRLDYFVAACPECKIQGTGLTPVAAVGHWFFQAKKLGLVIDQIRFDMRHEYTNSYVVMSGLETEIC